MPTIIYLKEKDQSQVMNHIADVARMGIDGDVDARELAKYIRQGLSQLKTVGIPSNHELVLHSHEENGDERSFRLLKPLKHITSPLFEFRINRSVPGAFRAIFFEYEYNGEQLLVFTRSILKQGDSNPPEFQTAIMESQILYQRFCRNPDRFLN